MNYKGVIIEESLDDLSALSKVTILKTRVEKVTVKHNTPWLLKWTLHIVEIKKADADKIAASLSNALDKKHSSWYADFKNKDYHYIIFSGKIFKVNLKIQKSEYQKIRDFGISIGIPSYQMNFEHLKR